MAKIDLTEGKILKKLFLLSLPIVATGFIQTAYNLIDMFWIGKLGTSEVAAVGTAGFYLWLSFGFVLLAATGTGIRVAQCTGEKEHKKAKGYTRTGLFMAVILGFLTSVVYFIFRTPLIAVFKIQDAHVVSMAISYLTYVCFGVFLSFITQVCTVCFNSRGKSDVPFFANSCGLVINLVLDPVLIFGIGPIPKMGVIGAGVATTFSQLVVLLLFIYQIKVKHSLFDTFVFFRKFDFPKARNIIKLGLPTAAFNIMFTSVGMVLAIIIAKYGASAIAVQKVGAQIEAISWMTASGFATAITSFTGQNFGAKKFHRVMYGYFSALKISLLLGFVNSFILVVFAKQLMQIFFHNDLTSIAQGQHYLVVMGLSQLFMCIDITTQGCFNGLGKTGIPAINSAVFTIARIPMAIGLSAIYGLDGVWVSIALSSIIKGIIIVIWFFRYVKKSEEFTVANMFIEPTDLREVSTAEA